MSGPKNNPYATLRVALDATQQEVSQSYERLQALLSEGTLASYGMLDPSHCEQLRQDLADAYALIGQPEQRASFDRGQHPWQIELNHEQALAPQDQAPPQSDPALATQPAGRELMADGSREESSAGLWPPPPVSERPRPRPSATSLLVASGKNASLRWLQQLAQQPEVMAQAQAASPGAGLEQLRDAAGASLEELSDVTKINRRYLYALEHDDFSQLPAGAYVRGFVGEYLRGLGLPGPTDVDVKQFVGNYMSKYQAWQQQL